MPTLAQKRRLDTLVGGPITAVLNLLARVLGFLLRRDHSLRQRPRRVLFIKLIGQGSIVHETNLIRAVREGYPEAVLGFVCFPEVRPLVERIDDIEEVIVLDDRSYGRLAWSVVRFVLGSWQRRPDLVIDLEVYSKFSTILSTLTCARDRAGYYVISTRFRRGLYTHLVYYNRQRHVQEAYRQLGRALHVEARVGASIPPRVDPEEHAEAVRLLREAELARRSGFQADAVPSRAGSSTYAEPKVLVVNVNAGELALERRWPAESFARVMTLFAARDELLMVMIGSPAEVEYTESVRTLVPEPERGWIVNLAGRSSYGVFLALLARADVLLTNDTGPLHLAWALGTATVSLWGPGSPDSYRPLTGDHRVLWAAPYCSPCLYFVDELPCAGDNLCMQQIGWLEVAAAVADLLGIEVELPVEERPPTSAYEPIAGYLLRSSVAEYLQAQRAGGDEGR